MTICQIWFLVVAIFCSMLNTCIYLLFNSQRYADQISWDSVEYTCIWRKDLEQVWIVIFGSFTSLYTPKSLLLLALVSAVNDDVFLCPVLYTINIFSPNIWMFPCFIHVFFTSKLFSNQHGSWLLFWIINKLIPYSCKIKSKAFENILRQFTFIINILPCKHRHISFYIPRTHFFLDYQRFYRSDLKDKTQLFLLVFRLNGPASPAASFR